LKENFQTVGLRNDFFQVLNRTEIFQKAKILYYEIKEKMDFVEKVQQLLFSEEEPR